MRLVNLWWLTAVLITVQGIPDPFRRYENAEGENGGKPKSGSSYGWSWFGSGHPFKRYKDYQSIISPRISGGREAGAGEVPYHVQITYQDTFICSGTLVKPKYGYALVLTTAECMTYKLNDSALILDHLTVIGGALHITKRLEQEQRRGVRRIERHPKWNRKTTAFDIAVVFIHYPFKLNKFVQPVIMAPYPDDSHQTATYTVAGWGYHQPGGSKLSDNLLIVDVPAIKFEECEKLYESWGPTPVKDLTLCIYDGTGATGPCWGDFGAGAVMFDKVVGKPVVVGIFYFVPDKTSIAHGCATHKWPALFVELDWVLQWLTEHSSPYLPNNVEDLGESGIGRRG